MIGFAPVVRGGRPLTGTVVSLRRRDLPATVAAGLLERLGATIADHGPTDVVIGAGAPPATADAPTALLVGDVPDGITGLPLGTIPYACGIATAAAAVLALLSDADVETSAPEVAVQVLLPAVIAAEYGTRHREPAPPRRFGDGALACDLASPDDEAAFTRLLDVVGADADARAIADEAQSWRLPVCEYVRRATPTRETSARIDDLAVTTDRSERRVPGAGPPPLAGVTVCDLTAMWAGPLATWLLAGVGATVHKIESSVRLDGMRGIDGGGITPPGVDPTSGTASGMFNALNRGKSCHDLDLGDPADRHSFLRIVRSSDLVIDSYSRRVMPNFGFTPDALRAERADLATVSLPAFPADHPWQVALGPAVHAAAGLGDLGGGRFAAPVVAYPDPLAGLTAFVTATALLHGRRRGVAPEHAEVTLFDATAPLAHIAPVDPVLRARDPDLGRQLLDDPALADAWETVTDGAGRHRYPPPPFRGAWTPVAPTPAPSIGAAPVR